MWAMLRPRLTAGLGLAIVLSGASAAEARSFRVANLPNGDRFGCRNCHNDNSGATMSPFGSDARNFLDGVQVQTAKVEWAEALCRGDSDNDGWSNGEELGDPDCTWQPGSPNPPGNVTNPGDPKSAPPALCGNDRLETGEDCDGAKLRKPDCAAIEAGEGSLACADDCSYDVSGCSGTPPESSGAGVGGGAGDAGDGTSSGCSMVTPRTAPGGPWAPAWLVGLALYVARRRAR
jgi:MYXO-CTERM domain-containing protein